MSLVPADAEQETAVNRQVETVQDDHARHLNKTTVERKRYHGSSSAWRCYTATDQLREVSLESLGNKASRT